MDVVSDMDLNSGIETGMGARTGLVTGPSMGLVRGTGTGLVHGAGMGLVWLGPCIGPWTLVALGYAGTSYILVRAHLGCS